MTAACIISPSSSIDNRRSDAGMSIGRTDQRFKPLDIAAVFARHFSSLRRQSWAVENACAGSAGDTTRRPPPSAPARERCGSSGLRSVRADDRRQRVTLPRGTTEHLEHLGELLLEHEAALVGGRLGVLFIERVAHLGDQALARRQATDQAACECLVGSFEHAPNVAPGAALAAPRRRADENENSFG